MNNPALRNAFGSLTAGVICGYLSHVVHNMSVLKLMAPHKNYRTLWEDYVKKSDTRWEISMKSRFVDILSTRNDIVHHETF